MRPRSPRQVWLDPHQPRGPHIQEHRKDPDRRRSGNPFLPITFSYYRVSLSSFRKLNLLSLCSGRQGGSVGPASGGRRSRCMATPSFCPLFQEVLESSQAALLEVAFLIAIVTFATSCRSFPWLCVSGLQCGDKAGVSRIGSLQASRSMGGEVHEDEGCLLIHDVESLGVSGRFLTADVSSELRSCSEPR